MSGLSLTVGLEVQCASIGLGVGKRALKTLTAGTHPKQLDHPLYGAGLGHSSFFPFETSRQFRCLRWTAALSCDRSWKMIRPRCSFCLAHTSKYFKLMTDIPEFWEFTSSVWQAPLSARSAQGPSEAPPWLSQAPEFETPALPEAPDCCGPQVVLLALLQLLYYQCVTDLFTNFLPLWKWP